VGSPPLLLLLLLLVPAPGVGLTAPSQVSAPAFLVAAAGGLTHAAPSPQIQEPVIDSRERVARATRREGEIRIDGHLDEGDWERAEGVTGFTQVEPDEGEPAMEPTEVRILYDDENIYLGARMHDSDPSRIARQLTRRDETGRAAGYFEFSFDPNLDRTTGYTFRVTAAGQQRDEFEFDDTRSDRAWDGVWESAVQVDDEGWTAEVRLPLSQLRYEPSPEPQAWGVDFARRRIAANERSEWAFVPIGTHGNVSRWGRLQGLHLSESSRYAEVLPYVMSGLEMAPAEPGDPFFDGTDRRTSVGADFRYGLGSTFVLDGTVNPDFGQVQVDPRVINLSAFETFFPERRPFFTRDDRLFDFSLSGGRNSLVHSRRIGRNPQGGAPSDADFVSLPSETTILGAGKVTGRTSGGLNVGALVAVTDQEEGRAYYAQQDAFQDFEVEPRTVYGTVRLEQELRDAQSRIGGIVTTVERDLPSDGSLDRIPRRAVTGGLDFEHTWSDREWAVWGFAAGSHVEGSTEAITRLQRSSNHFFQRPDQDYLDFDPEATSMSGAEWRLQFERRSGRHWTGAVWFAQRTPGFEVNDMGFSTSTERLDAGARIEYREPTPGDVFRSYRFSAFTFHNWRHDVVDDFFSAGAWGGAHKAGRVNVDADFTFLNWWGVGIDLGYEPEVLSDVLTRGGPLMVDPGSREVSVRFNTDRRDAVTVRSSVEYEQGSRGGWEFSSDVGVEVRPTSGIVFGLFPSYSRELDTRQYVTAFEDEGFQPTFGARYLFSDLKREELSLETRLDLIFTPDLSLEVFVQPLVSAGDFRNAKQLARARSFEFRRFEEGEAVEGAAAEGERGVRCAGGDLCRAGGRLHLDFDRDGVGDASFRDPDFTIRSVRGNAVLRWEYRPGSRVYLVWQQSRQSRLGRGDFDLGRDLGGLFRGDGEHVFMLKVDHWVDLF